MAITLPTSPAPRKWEPRPVSYRTNQTPVLGGPENRIGRLGTRWAVDVEIPPMRYTAAMAWLSAFSQAEDDTVLMKVHQPGFSTGAPGTPLVNGAGQLGKTLDADGLTPQHFLKDGQFFSLIHSSRRYLHLLSSDLIVDAAGEVTLAFTPMLRVSPADNAVLEIAQPMIEGFLGFSGGTPVTADQIVHGLAFTITERA